MREREIQNGISDEELLTRSSTGDAAAFTALYQRRQGCIYRFALQMSGAPDVAEEVTQDVFLLLIREPGQYDAARGSLAAFLYGVARNYTLRQIERGRRYVPIVQDDAAAPDGTAENLERRERIESVREAVLALPARYREAVVLCDLHELSYAEAALATGCAVGTIRSRLHRARGLLTGKLRAGGKGCLV